MPTAQQQADDWNRDNQTGIIVDVDRGNGEILRTVTRSHAQVLSGIASIFVKPIGWSYPLAQITRVPAADDWTFEWNRAGGGAVCVTCGKEYKAHPDDLDHPSYDGLPWLVKLCDGRLVKL